MTEQKEELETMRKKFTKKGFRIASIVETGPVTEFTVFWQERGKVKLGTIRNPYRFRYGPKTQVSLTAGSDYPWFRSTTDAETVPPILIEAMKSGSWKDYPELDVNDMELIW